MVRRSRFVVILVVICGWAVPFAVLAAPVERTLTDTKGRTIDATLIEVSGDSVRIRRRSDGKEFSIALKTLSEADRGFIADWDQKRDGDRDRDGRGVESDPGPMRVELKVRGEAVELERWGSGPKGVVFFNHSGPMDKEIRKTIGDYSGLIEGGYSIFLWSYPKVKPFSDVQKVLGAGGGSLSFRGVATELVDGIREAAELDHLCLVGNSLGAGVISWDLKKLLDDQDLSVVLISPTPFFTAQLPDLRGRSRVALFCSENDPFVKQKSDRRNLLANRHESCEGMELSGHLIIGENFKAKQVEGAIRAVMP